MSHTKDSDLQREPLTQKLTSIIDVHSHIILDLGDSGTQHCSIPALPSTYDSLARKFNRK
jgi:hypothetical protein